MAGKARPALVSAAPTNPRSAEQSQRFDVADLYRGPAAVEESTRADTPLDERLRQAYFWIVNNAIISPHYDFGNSSNPKSGDFGYDPVVRLREHRQPEVWRLRLHGAYHGLHGEQSWGNFLSLRGGRLQLPCLLC